MPKETEAWTIPSHACPQGIYLFSLIFSFFCYILNFLHPSNPPCTILSIGEIKLLFAPPSFIQPTHLLMRLPRCSESQAKLPPSLESTVPAPALLKHH